MLRLLILVFGTGVAALALSGSASAGSDITVAAIATGRLYVIGTTDHPPMPVMLDEKFPTESDDQGKFQYELVYYPPGCVVAASIEGKTHEAVVSNCGQQMMPGTWLEPKAAIDTPALMKRLTNAKAELSSATLCQAKSAEQRQEPAIAEPTTSAPPVFTVVPWTNLFAWHEPGSMLPNQTGEVMTPAAISQDVSRTSSIIAVEPTKQPSVSPLR
jgi:hypothetical protein